MSTDTLAGLLPAPHHTQLLQAALLPEDSGRDAWAAWNRSVADPVAALKSGQRSVNQWLALLCDNLLRNDVTLEHPVAPYLRAAVLHEELRARTCRTICHNLLRELAPLPLVVLNDAALADDVYPRAGLRHVHDLQLLLSSNDLHNAVQRLQSRGLGVLSCSASSTASRVELTHPSGFPVALTCVVPHPPYGSFQDSGFWQRSRGARVADVPVRIPSPEDMLLQALAAATSSASCNPLVWVCDAYHMLSHYPAVDWYAVLARAQPLHLVPPVAVIVRYLATALQAPIPDSIVTTFEAAAMRNGRLGYELAWQSLCNRGRESRRSLWRRSVDWHARGALLRWMLFPSMDFLRATGALRRSWMAPLVYLYRPLAYLKRRASSLRSRTAPDVRRPAPKTTTAGRSRDASAIL